MKKGKISSKEHQDERMKLVTVEILFLFFSILFLLFILHVFLQVLHYLLCS